MVYLSGYGFRRIYQNDLAVFILRKYIVKDICEGYIAKIIVKYRKQETQINTNKYK